MSERLRVCLVTASNRNIRVYRLQNKMEEEIGRQHKPSKAILNSSAYDKVIRRHRNNEQVLQIMKFIRDQERQPIRTQRDDGLVYLQKPAPLPGIRSKQRERQRQENRSSDSEESGYNGMNDTDSESELELYNRTIPSPPRSHSPDGAIGTVARSNVLSKSYSQHDCFVPRERRKNLNLQRTTTISLTNSVHQLPPIDRAGLPSRPSAPPPSFTPPLPDDLDDFTREEPIDYIDPE
ncbi:uncharacterized protein [Ptychodera flava]|uniref:uncharacterized protein n=1 Tax=Ptychodera flava TaxID=63121 RepID=UPI00396A8AE3